MICIRDSGVKENYILQNIFTKHCFMVMAIQCRGFHQPVSSVNRKVLINHTEHT